MTIVVTDRGRPVATLQTLLLRMKVDVLEFELQQLRTVARGLIEAGPGEKKKWWIQLKVLTGNGRSGDPRS